MRRSDSVDVIVALKSQVCYQVIISPKNRWYLLNIDHIFYCTFLVPSKQHNSWQTSSSKASSSNFCWNWLENISLITAFWAFLWVARAVVSATAAALKQEGHKFGSLQEGFRFGLGCVLSPAAALVSTTRRDLYPPYLWAWAWTDALACALALRWFPVFLKFKFRMRVTPDRMNASRITIQAIPDCVNDAGVYVPVHYTKVATYTFYFLLSI